MKKFLSLFLAVMMLICLYSVECFASTDNVVYQEEDKDSKVTVVYEGTFPVAKKKAMQLGEDESNVYASTYAVTLEKKKSATALDTTGSYRFNATVYYSVKYLDPTSPLDKKPYAKLLSADMNYEQLDHVAYLTSFEGSFTQTGITENGNYFDESVYDLSIPLNNADYTKTFTVPSYFEYVNAQDTAIKSLLFRFEFGVGYTDGSSPENVAYTINIDSV